VTSGLANEVELVNQYVAVTYVATTAGTAGGRARRHF
jgi:hypothetical protein